MAAIINETILYRVSDPESAQRVIAYLLTVFDEPADFDALYNSAPDKTGFKRIYKTLDDFHKGVVTVINAIYSGTFYHTTPSSAEQAQIYNALDSFVRSHGFDITDKNGAQYLQQWFYAQIFAPDYWNTNPRYWLNLSATYFKNLQAQGGVFMTPAQITELTAWAKEQAIEAYTNGANPFTDENFVKANVFEKYPFIIPAQLSACLEQGVGQARYDVLMGALIQPSPYMNENLALEMTDYDAPEQRGVDYYGDKQPIYLRRFNVEKHIKRMGYGESDVSTILRACCDKQPFLALAADKQGQLYAAVNARGKSARFYYFPPIMRANNYSDSLTESFKTGGALGALFDIETALARAVGGYTWDANFIATGITQGKTDITDYSNVIGVRPSPNISQVEYGFNVSERKLAMAYFFLLSYPNLNMLPKPQLPIVEATNELETLSKSNYAGHTIGSPGWITAINNYLENKYLAPARYNITLYLDTLIKIGQGFVYNPVSVADFVNEYDVLLLEAQANAAKSANDLTNPIIQQAIKARQDWDSLTAEQRGVVSIQYKSYDGKNGIGWFGNRVVNELKRTAKKVGAAIKRAVKNIVKELGNFLKNVIDIISDGIEIIGLVLAAAVAVMAVIFTALVAVSAVFYVATVVVLTVIGALVWACFYLYTAIAYLVNLGWTYVANLDIAGFIADGIHWLVTKIVAVWAGVTLLPKVFDALGLSDDSDAPASSVPDEQVPTPTPNNGNGLLLLGAGALAFLISQS